MQLLQEANGKFSSNRLIFIVGSAWNMIMVSALAFLGEGVAIAGLVSFFAAIQSVLITLKLGQKNMEAKK